MVNSSSLLWIESSYNSWRRIERAFISCKSPDSAESLARQRNQVLLALNEYIPAPSVTMDERLRDPLNPEPLAYRACVRSRIPCGHYVTPHCLHDNRYKKHLLSHSYTQLC